MSLWTGLALRKRMKGYYRFPSWTTQLIKNRNSSLMFKELWKQSSHLTPSQREIFSWCSNNVLLTSHKAEMCDFFIVDIYRKQYRKKVQKRGDEAYAPVPQAAPEAPTLLSYILHKSCLLIYFKNIYKQDHERPSQHKSRTDHFHEVWYLTCSLGDAQVACAGQKRQVPGAGTVEPTGHSATCCPSAQTCRVSEMGWEGESIIGYPALAC